ncbi:hypothetical protein C8N46_101613 [Kordia periserrulae]|uniref:Uncharacterized protein n=1 Tax=Kordia periserrulae TaxID=701523 RepID=A0A2T6C6T3_9FLAO|nr:hypothetical protein [Kordia periserrulae]PTX64003.1 hypothetical protein C8N46_101613 [Kordia periserrulae]
MLSSTFQKLSNTTEKKLLFLAIACFLLAGSCMMHFDEPLKSEVSPLGIVSLELAKTLENATQILNTWNATETAMQAAEWSLWFDYVFIITYVLLLCLMLHRTRRMVWKETTSLAYRIGTVLITMVVFAGLLDMVENFALLQLFYGDLQSHWVHLAFATATIKFINIVIGILYVIISWLMVGIKKLT